MYFIIRELKEKALINILYHQIEAQRAHLYTCRYDLSLYVFFEHSLLIKNEGVYGKRLVFYSNLLGRNHFLFWLIDRHQDHTLYV